MATNKELIGLENNSDLQDKVRAACFKAANTIQEEPENTPKNIERLRWADKAWGNPDSIVLPMLRAVLAANSTTTVGNIIAATDASIQINVDSAVNVFALQISVP